MTIPANPAAPAPAPAADPTAPTAPTVPTVPAAAPEAAEPGESAEPKDWQADAEKWKRQSRENETRAKAKATEAVDALGGDFLDDAGQVDDAAITEALAGLLERKPHWAAAAGSRTPRPDPSQGARPGGTVSVDDQIREAQSKNDWKTVLSLQNSKLATTRPQ